MNMVTNIGQRSWIMTMTLLDFALTQCANTTSIAGEIVAAQCCSHKPVAH